MNHLHIIFLCAFLFTNFFPGEPAGAGEVTIKAVSYAPLGTYSDGIRVFEEFIERVNIRGTGRIRIDHIGGDEVIPIREQVAAVGKGIVDMTMVHPAHASLVPEVHTVRLSRISVHEERETGYIDLLDEAHRKLNVKVIGRATTNSGFHIYSNKKIDSLDDFEGLRIRSHAGYDPFFKALGANPVHMATSEAYTAMARGLVDAVPNPIFVYGMGIHEVARYALENSFWNAHSFFIYMNRRQYEALPEDTRAIIMDVQLGLEEDMDDIVAAMIAQEKKRLQGAGMVFTELPDEEAGKWQELALESWWSAFSARLDFAQAERIKRMILR